MRDHPHPATMARMLDIEVHPRDTTFARAGVPQLPEHWLRRPRLLARLSETGPGETTLLAALAGSGKTMLLADWFTNDRTTDGAWVSVARRDDEPTRLASRCATALGFENVATVSYGSEADAFDRLFEALEARGRPAVLVIDDVHELRTRTAAQALHHLTMYAPPSLRIML